MSKLHPHLQELVDALKSGDYKQGKGALFDGVGHCCIGVMCRIALGDPESSGGSFSWQGAHCSAPISVREHFGLHSVIGGLVGKNLRQRESLVEANDVGVPFEEIAAFIEAHPEVVSTLKPEDVS